MGLLTLFLLIRSTKSEKTLSKRMQFAIFMTVFLATISTITYIYAVSIPIFIVLVSQLWKIRHNAFLLNTKTTLKSWLIILPSSTISSVLVAASSNNSAGIRSRLSWSNFDFLKMQNLFLGSFSRNLLSSGVIVRFICLLFICVAFLSLFIFIFCSNDILISSNNSSLVLLLQISVSSLISSLICTFLSSGIVDEYFLRYFWPAIFMLMIFALALSVQIFSKFQRNIYRKLRIELFLISTLLIIFATTPSSIRNNDYRFANTAKCLEEIRTGGTKLNAGVADYWFGRSVDYLSSGSNRTYVALNSLAPYYWMTTDSYYKTDANYNFILLHTQPDQFGFNLENMKSLLPAPSRTFVCKDTDIIVYYYENDSLNILIREAKIKYFNSNPKG